jgi:hypothetical protein
MSKPYDPEADCVHSDGGSTIPSETNPEPAVKKKKSHQETCHLLMIKKIQEWEVDMSNDAATRDQSREPKAFRKRAKRLIAAEEARLEKLVAKRKASADKAKQERAKRKAEAPAREEAKRQAQQQAEDELNEMVIQNLINGGVKEEVARAAFLACKAKGEGADSGTALAACPKDASQNA